MNHSLVELQEFAKLLTRRQARKLYESKSGKKYEPEYIEEDQYYGDDFDSEYYDFEKRQEYDPDEDLIRDIKIRDWEENIDTDNLDDYEDLLDSYDYKLGHVKLDEDEAEYDSLEEDDLDNRLMMRISVPLSEIPYSLEEVIDLTEEEGYAYEPYDPEMEQSEEEPETDEDEMDESEDLDDYENEEDLESLEEILKTKEDEDRVYVFQEDADDIESDLYIVYPVEKKREIRSFLVNTLQVEPETADMIIDDAIMADETESELID